MGLFLPLDLLVLHPIVYLGCVVFSVVQIISSDLEVEIAIYFVVFYSS
jgi:hypothetical protein